MLNDSLNKCVFKCCWNPVKPATSRGKPFRVWDAATPKTDCRLFAVWNATQPVLWLDTDRRRFREPSSTAYCRAAADSGAMLLRRRNRRSARRNAIRYGMRTASRKSEIVTKLCNIWKVKLYLYQCLGRNIMEDRSFNRGFPSSVRCSI